MDDEAMDWAEEERMSSMLSDRRAQVFDPIEALLDLHFGIWLWPLFPLSPPIGRSGCTRVNDATALPKAAG